jgi:predicted membrane-bound dolichyl-phosphate-mannose-protein mannosyltransferase
MQTLGNLCSAAGFKNVIVDKENFQFNITRPEEVWNFIRHIGESNYLLKRKNFIVNKSLFKEFYKRYNKEIKDGDLKKNTLSIYYLIGKK